MFSPPSAEPVIPMVSSYSAWAITDGLLANQGPPASAAWESANRVVYQPVRVPTSCVVRRVWWANGATTSGAANVSVAIYNATATGKPAAKIVECAATTQGTASQVQFVDISDTTLAPGLYWIGLAASSVTNTTFFRRSGFNYSDAFYRCEQESITVGALPATATPVESTGTNFYLFGFATTASP